MVDIQARVVGEMLGSKWRAEEIEIGVVIFLSPSILKADGGAWFPPDGSPIEGDHYFLCIEVSGEDTFWVPLSSKPGEHRIAIPTNQKRGHKARVSTPSFALARQYWLASRSMIVEAALLAGDNSDPENRNRVLPQVTREIALTAVNAPLA